MEACLQVHRFDRALSLLRQLQVILNPSSKYLREAFNACLHAMVMDMIANKNSKNMVMINDWVEVTMQKAGVVPDAKTYALKVKVALATMIGSKRDRTVKRYWDLARKSENINEVASLRNILSDQDLGKLSEIVPHTGMSGFEDHQTADDMVEIVDQPAIAKRGDHDFLETDLKGLGLITLRKQLSLFSGESHFEFSGNAEEYAQARQRRLEVDAVNTATERWRMEHDKMQRMGLTVSFQQPRLGPMLWQWHQKIVARISKELELVEEAETKVRKTEEERLRCEHGPFLRLLTPSHLSALVIIRIVGALDKNEAVNSLRLTRLVTSVGRFVEAEWMAEEGRRSTYAQRGPTRRGTIPLYQRLDRVSSSPSHCLSRAERVAIRRKHLHHTTWSPAIQARLGAFLCEQLFDVAKITVSKQDPTSGKRLTVSQAAFTHCSEYHRGKKIGVVKMHSELIKRLVSQPSGSLLAKHLPMVCEPQPWTGFLGGGFLDTPSNFLRVKGGEVAQKDYVEAAAARGDLDQMFAGIDVLGKTAWKINLDVFSVMVKAWNSGEAVANIPPLDSDLPTIEKPETTGDQSALIKWYAAVRHARNLKQGLHSVRCFQNFQMEIAKAYSGEVFYLPHNIDFRGRAYPLPPYLNQMGADNCRGLLMFAKGRQLGDVGLRWLKIHLSNVFGYDKASLKDRESFPMEHLSEVVDSVVNPLDGRRWWLEAEDPWQCLAACFELKQALDMPDPTQFVSFLPIHQDGSCNGLQHYAALGGDVDGAKQVNLEPGDKPADVYTGVAELVRAEVRADAKQGDAMALLVDGKITRKIVKQTVMTNVYGVTFIGAVRQVRRQIEVIVPEWKVGVKPPSIQASIYIARKIFRALGALFSGAHDIQYWFGDCASRISASLSPSQIEAAVKAEEEERAKDAQAGVTESSLLVKRTQRANAPSIVPPFRTSVIWTTPLRLPVVQPYRTKRSRKISTNLQEMTLAEPSGTEAIDKRKQLQAFPPNFIHSLDATHMLLSALKCYEAGLAFTAVHDSFWTHAADVDTLNRLLREAFIRMHSEDIVGRLAAEFRARYKGHMYLAKVANDSPLGRKVKKLRKSMYVRANMFKPSAPEQRHELFLETKRLRLLASADPAEQEKGRAMVTPGSLYEDLNGEQYLHARNSLGETAIGMIPTDPDMDLASQALQKEKPAADVDLARSLEPLSDGEVQEEDHDETEPVKSRQATKIEPHGNKKYSKGQASQVATWIWLPLTFRPVPKKVSPYIRHDFTFADA